MDLYYISVLVGILVILTYFTFEDLFLKKWMKMNGIKYHYDFLKGISTGKKVSLSGGSKSKLLNNTLLVNTCAVCCMLFLLSILVFKSVIFSIIISLFGFLYPKIYTENMKKKRITLLNLQLRDALNSISTSLKAGLSINSALIKCITDLERVLISTREKPILDEFKKIKADLDMGLSVDDALRNFSKRVRIDDVDDFTNSIIIVRQKGGNLVEVVGNVTNIINAKIMIKAEINRLTAGKKMESKVITSLPIMVIVLLSFLSPQYMQPLIATFWGRILIIFGIVLLITNYFIGKKIVDIKV